MKPAPALIVFLFVGAVLGTISMPAAGEGIPPIAIEHTPPSGATPGHQIYLTAVLTNATAAAVAWRNDTMTADATMPMTNLSEPNGSGWVFAAYLPAQPVPTQIVYSINASNAGGFRQESFFFSVDLVASGGLTSADQESWVWTMAASLAMVISTVAVLYWYVGRRLAREAE